MSKQDRTTFDAVLLIAAGAVDRDRQALLRSLQQLARSGASPDDVRGELVSLTEGMRQIVELALCRG